ncbi:hypothetical protein EVAR_62067_1 [Eumeta japonica]|uniref:Uncharacterized protein n=1 Tax=Eumeta variegata TaxID=151549 RepID=A0A4C1YSC2_EUMVA|nr:hypothetical protein EVAR_62067_1 [Eumeta japonica]
MRRAKNVYEDKTRRRARAPPPDMQNAERSPNAPTLSNLLETLRNFHGIFHATHAPAPARGSPRVRFRRYLIPTQEADNALATLLRLRISMGGDDLYLTMTLILFSVTLSTNLIIVIFAYNMLPMLKLTEWIFPEVWQSFLRKKSLVIENGLAGKRTCKKRSWSEGKQAPQTIAKPGLTRTEIQNLPFHEFKTFISKKLHDEGYSTVSELTRKKSVGLNCSPIRNFLLFFGTRLVSESSFMHWGTKERPRSRPQTMAMLVASDDDKWNIASSAANLSIVRD